MAKSSPQIPVTAVAARRFILGKQGLWPGRRWQGLEGVRQAIKSVEHLQLDPLNVAGRAHDLILQARVSGYRPEMLEQAAYAERGAFDWGDWLALRPMAELPYYRVNMRHRAKRDYYTSIATEHKAAVKWVRAEIERRGPLRNRDLEGAKRVESYRGRTDTALALFYLWIKGELMTSARPRFERLYDLAERVAPKASLAYAPERDADRFHALKLVAFQGIGKLNLLGHWIDRPLSADEIGKITRQLVKTEAIVPVKVNASRWTGEYFVRTEDVSLLDEVCKDGAPRAWDGPASQRVTFLSPLDVVSARGRAKRLFNFDYVWEVYKPLKDRLWGYYVLPILWGDRLVARIDVRKTVDSPKLEALGFWLEDAATAKDPAFAAAFRGAFADFLVYLDADGYKVAGPGATVLRALVEG